MGDDSEDDNYKSSNRKEQGDNTLEFNRYDRIHASIMVFIGDKSKARKVSQILIEGGYSDQERI